VTKLAYSDNRVSGYKFRVTQNVAEYYADDNRAILVHARARAKARYRIAARRIVANYYSFDHRNSYRENTRTRGHLRTHRCISRFNEVTFDEYEKKKEKKGKKRKNHTSSCHVFNTGSNTHR